MTESHAPRLEIPIEALRTFGLTAYRSVGVDEDSARTVVSVQLDADLRGVDTHGFQRLPWYIDHLRLGRNNPRPHFQVRRESPVSLVIDADNALGQLACVRLVEQLIHKAGAIGLAAGATRCSNDWGCGAYYPLLAARAGFICFGTTTSIPMLAPYGTRTRLVGNNPMVFAIPRREESPIVLDMALTPVALGKVLRSMAEGRPIPAEWGFLDQDGRPTTDSDAALGGIVPAIGGYKGTGLALIMNVLAGVLPGGAHGSSVGLGHRGQFMMVVSPELFDEPGAFLDGVEAMVDQVKSAEPLPDSLGPFLPGEIEEQKAAAARLRGTVEYPLSVVRELSTMATTLGMEAPTELRRSE